MLLLHGSPHDFKHFDDERPVSLGHHFGDLEQALHRIAGNGFIYEVVLTINNPLMVEKDFGWEHPEWTVKGLIEYRLFSYSELVGLQDRVGKGISIYPWKVPDDEKRKRNQIVIAYLQSKGHDSILYPNTNEPRDDRSRPAVCVFNGQHVEIKKQYKCPLDPDQIKSLERIKRG